MTDTSVFPRREFYMVRHGQTEHNKKRKLSSTYTLLTPEGQEQAAHLKEVHDHLPDKDRLYYVSSAAPRAIETCRIMTDDKDHKCIEALNERTTGRAAGWMTQSFYEKIARDQDYLTKNAHRFKKIGMERREDHAATVIPAVRSVLEECPAQQIPIIVSHFGTIHHTAEAVGVSSRQFENAQMYHFKPIAGDQKAWEITHVVLENGKIVERPLMEELKTHNMSIAI